MIAPGFTALPRRLLLVLLGCSAAAAAFAASDSPLPMSLPATTPRPFNGGWKFHRGDQPGAAAPAFDDRGWRSLDLPHDWSIEPISGTQLHDQATPEGASVGYLRGGIGWYRKHFILDRTDEGRAAELIFDGAQQDTDVWLNGHHLTFQPHGYIPFHVDLTPHLRPAGEENVVVVRTLNPEANTRWYAGSGLYRPVTLRVHDRAHFAVWGARVDTAWIAGEKALLQFQLTLSNSGSAPVDTELELVLQTPDGQRSVHPLGQARLAPGRDETIGQQLALTGPKLWSPDSPQLYTAEFRLLRNGQALDVCTTTFGVRTVSLAPDRGLLLNGQPVKLKGACLHHDNGLLGAAAFAVAEERRVRIMKNNGYNAIRTSHNPPSAAFLEACDRLGMLVIDEFADQWMLPKKVNGYQRYFATHWEADLGAMLARDFNHPSIIIWSIGNEIAERAKPTGIEIGRRLAEFVRRQDPRRPVTNALCGFWDNPEWDKQWDPSAPAFSILDIGGYNYQWAQYESDHAKFPQRYMLGTESYAREAWENWRLVEKHPYVLGDFVWTGMDHIGESGIGHTSYMKPGTDPEKASPAPWELMPWPWWINWSGDIDLIGDKKPPSFYRDVLWGQSKVELAVHEPMPADQVENVGFWGWPAEFQSWNWAGHESTALSVNVYSRAGRVRLELNGRVVGEQAIDPARGITATFTVPYEPGRLIATALSGDQSIGTCELTTTGRPASLRISAETTRATADRATIVYLPIAVLDSAGRVVPDAAVPLTLSVSGPAELIGFGSANPTDIGLLQDAQAESFRGRALAILRSTGQPGSVTVQLQGATLQSASATVQFTEGGESAPAR